MRTTTRRTETTSETLTLLITRRSTSATRVFWCGLCDTEVLWITPKAIELFGIFDLPKSNAVHMTGEEICSRSLIEEIRKGEIL